MRFAAADHRTGERNGAGITLHRLALDRRTAGKSQLQDFCRLVESLAQRVIDGRGQPAILAHAVNPEDLAVAAGYEKQGIRKVDAFVGKAGAQSMAFEVVYRDEGNVGGHCQCLRADQADHDPPDEARPGGGGNRIAIRQRDIGIGEHAVDHRSKPFGMGARGNFRHDAAERRMFRILRCDALRHDATIAVDECDCGFVARTFYAENQCHPAFP